MAALPKKERIIWDSPTGNIKEAVFSYKKKTKIKKNDVGQVDLGIASRLIEKDVSRDVPTLLLPGSAVGRLFFVTTANGKVPTSLYGGGLYINQSTGFLVSDDILCTARHVLEEGEVAQAGYFTFSRQMTREYFTSRLSEFHYPYATGNVSAAFNNSMAKEDLYPVTIIPPSQDHATKFKTLFVERDLIPQDPELPLKRNENDEIPTWHPRDFTFVQLTTKTSQIWLVPTPILKNDSIDLIAYASEPDITQSKEHYTAEVILAMRSIFGGLWDTRFHSGGTIKDFNTHDADGNVRLVAHTANCEAASSGGPIIPLTEGADSYTEFCAVHVGSWGHMAHFNIAVPTTSRSFFMEWATHVIPSVRELIKHKKLDRNDRRVPQLKAYVEMVIAMWPQDYTHPARNWAGLLLDELNILTG